MLAKPSFRHAGRSSSGNIKGVYDEGIRKAVGPTASKTAPLKTAGGAIVKDKLL